MRDYQLDDQYSHGIYESNNLAIPCANSYLFEIQALFSLAAPGFPPMDTEMYLKAPAIVPNGSLL